MTAFWVTLRFRGSGAEQTHTFRDALSRGLLIIATARYADVIAVGER